MPKYLVNATYTGEGIKGVIKEGGTSRKKAVEKMAADLGGKLEAYYFTFGDDGVVAIFDLPDMASASAVISTVNASCCANTRVSILITPEELDKIASMKVNYRPPGE